MIVTIVAYKRPELLEKCLDSVAKADLSPVTQIVVSLDRHSPEMSERMVKVCHNSHKIRATNPKILGSIKHLPYRLGVANHPREVFNDVFSAPYDHVMDSICALEEDTIVSPDAFVFADWALRQPGYKFVNLYQPSRAIPHGDYAEGWQQRATERVHEDNELRGGFGWAFTHAFWSELEPQWNGKIRLPYGWDWQLTYLCYRNNWRCLTPEVSRVYNTGREGGTYDTVEEWDTHRKDVVICQAAPDKYVVVKHDLDSVTKPNWVKEEMK